MNRMIARKNRWAARIIEALRFDISPALLTRLMALSVCAICVVFGYTLYGSYEDIHNEARSSARNIAEALTQDITRNLETLDLSLQAAVEGWQQPDIHTLRPELQNMILFDRSASSADTGGIIILNAQGDIVSEARSVVPRKGNFADREFFRAHVDNPNRGLFISAPFESRLGGGWMIGVSRRINNPDGSFGGVASAGVKLDYFKRIYSRIYMGKSSAITLVSTDGTIIMRYPFVPDQIGKSVAESSSFKQMVGKREGTYHAASIFDGIDRMYYFKAIEPFPIMQSVALSHEEIFAAWWRKSTTLILILCALCIAIASLTAIFASELSRRIAAEAQLAAAARTDALTKLGNRRMFDETLEYEWARAARERATVSLLMIDADHFKAYNDTYGHVAGDAVLASLGACIGARLRRPADVGTRYGGEEFAVILPNTSPRGALRLAELIRRGVEELGIKHSGSATGFVSVSIGVASANLATAKEAVDLVMYADAALYAAKAEGRNRVSAHIEPEVEQRAA